MNAITTKPAPTLPTPLPDGVVVMVGPTHQLADVLRGLLPKGPDAPRLHDPGTEAGPPWEADPGVRQIHLDLLDALTTAPCTRKALMARTRYTDYSNVCKAVRYLVKKKYLRLHGSRVCRVPGRREP